MFQSRAGFSGLCDRRAPGLTGYRSLRFNPVLGFLVSATPAPREVDNDDLGFQSRAGFSGLCDDRSRRDFRRSMYVSIPCWVFWSLRLSSPSTYVRRVPCFNPVLGFLVSATIDHRGRISNYRLLFQSRAGFSGLCDFGRWTVFTITFRRFQSRAGFSGLCDIFKIGSAPERFVSIPCWVFWSLRRPELVRRRARVFVSIPCWVFWSLRPTAGDALAGPWLGFNPVLGFLVSATSGTGAFVST